MNLTRLAYTQHPRPPQRELRQKSVLDSGGRLIGHMANIYVDDDRNFRFVDVAMGGHSRNLERCAQLCSPMAKVDSLLKESL
jgi:hypothetical protein